MHKAPNIHQKHLIITNTAAVKLFLETEKHCETEVYEMKKSLYFEVNKYIQQNLENKIVLCASDKYGILIKLIKIYYS